MGSDKKTVVLESALDLLREGGVLSLDSVARGADLTKPGLMYHFPTKEALMLGIVDHVTSRYVRRLEELLQTNFADATPADRMRAYLDWAFGATFDAADLVAFSDPRLRGPMAKRWAERLGPWFAAPDDMPADVKACLDAARLIADGTWLADATDTLALDDGQRAAVRSIAGRLIGDPA